MFKRYRVICARDRFGNEKKIKLSGILYTDKPFVHFCIDFLEAPIGNYLFHERGEGYEDYISISKTLSEDPVRVVVNFDENFKKGRDFTHINVKKYVYVDRIYKLDKYVSLFTDGFSETVDTFAYDMLRNTVVEWMYRPGNPGARKAKEHFEQWAGRI